MVSIEHLNGEKIKRIHSLIQHYGVYHDNVAKLMPDLVKNIKAFNDNRITKVFSQFHDLFVMNIQSISRLKSMIDHIYFVYEYLESHPMGDKEKDALYNKKHVKAISDMVEELVKRFRDELYYFDILKREFGIQSRTRLNSLDQAQILAGIEGKINALVANFNGKKKEFEELYNAKKDDHNVGPAKNQYEECKPVREAAHKYFQEGNYGDCEKEMRKALAMIDRALQMLRGAESTIPPEGPPPELPEVPPAPGEKEVPSEEPERPPEKRKRPPILTKGTLIHGKVTDEKDNPVSEASVMARYRDRLGERNTRAVKTFKDGNYSINEIPAGSTLIFVAAQLARAQARVDTDLRIPDSGIDHVVNLKLGSIETQAPPEETPEKPKETPEESAETLEEMDAEIEETKEKIREQNEEITEETEEEKAEARRAHFEEKKMECRKILSSVFELLDEDFRVRMRDLIVAAEDDYKEGKIEEAIKKIESAHKDLVTAKRRLDQ